MDAAIIAENQDEDGNPTKTKQTRRRRHPQNRRVDLDPHDKKGKKKARHAQSNSDSDDDDFASGSGSSSSESSDGDEVQVTNVELADALPTRSVPTRAPGKSRRRSTVRKESQSARESATPVSTPPTTTARPRNPAYLFFERVPLDCDGKPGEKGDMHWKCLHGSGHVLSITVSMKASVTGLVQHLRNFPAEYRLYQILAERYKRDPKIPPTADEVAFASGVKSYGPKDEADYLKNIRKLGHSGNSIADSFSRQRAKQAGPWDQEKFETLLAQWIVTCDQPFDEVEKAEFIELLQYTHHPSSDLHIPGRKAIRARIKKMHTTVQAELKEMFKNLNSKVSISLDAWTSSNGYAFLAIVAHYVTNSGKLEETMIDFRELIGEHSGDNMADAVWETLTTFNLQDRITAFVMDNATNNDTMVEAIEGKCQVAKIKFSSQHSRLRCMPHTVHLAAIKLLESIGAVEKPKSGKAKDGYQEIVSVPVDAEYDGDAVMQDDEDGAELTNAALIAAVRKLRRIVRAVRSSPQRRAAWKEEVTTSYKEKSVKDLTGYMLILDVKTRWSSTHQMMRRALDWRVAIDNFVDKHRELRHLELSPGDWDAIVLVAGWLEAFRTATTEMSATKTPMISTTHAVFRGLQDHLRATLRTLPDTAVPQLKEGIVAAHTKLSEYYTKFDDSPLYTWAGLLDPRLSYEGMKRDYAADVDLADYLEQSKTNLQKHFDDNYAKAAGVAGPVAQPSTSTAPAGPSKFSFTARYEDRARITADEMADFFALPRESFQTCDPIAWWYARRHQFPKLHRLALDLLSIPGSAVAVERIFSGGRDTISLRRASLKAETISTLMFVKNQLRMRRNALNVELGDD